MAETHRPIRLSKAAKEFNISLDTVVEYLSSHGFKVERNPNFKLDQAMYSKLSEEFEQEKVVKEIASKKGIEYVGRETITLEDMSKKEKGEEDIISLDIDISFEEEVEEEVTTTVKKAPPVPETPEVPVEEEKAEEKVVEEEKETEEETTGPKIVGKVDLEGMNLRTRPKKQPRETRKKKAEAKKKEEPKKRVKKEETKPETKEEVSTEKAPEPVKEQPVTEEKAPEPVAEEVKEKAGKEDNFIPTKVETLSGPTVVDKIKLPEKPKHVKKKPVVSSDHPETHKKKKRKRIRAKVDHTVTGKTTKNDKTRTRQGKEEKRQNRTFGRGNPETNQGNASASCTCRKIQSVEIPQKKTGTHLAVDERGSYP